MDYVYEKSAYLICVDLWYSVNIRFLLYVYT